MSKLLETYNQVSKRTMELNNKIKDASTEIKNIASSVIGDSSIRIAKLEEQLVKIDEYLLKIKGFQELAQKNLDSQNVLTIEAPPGYRVNLNRLRNWAMMIDPMSSNDPYAQRVYVVAKCDEFFLEQKQKEFQDRIEQLKTAQDFQTNKEIEALKEAIQAYELELKNYATSADVSNFAQEVISENNKYWYKSAPNIFANCKEIPEYLAPGAYAAPFSFNAEQKAWLKTLLGDFYDEKGGRVLLPVEISNLHEYIMTITCSPAKRKKLDRALQNLLLSTINKNPVGSRKVYVLDAVRYNSSSLGSLRELEGTFALSQIPRNPEQLTSALEQIVSNFSDIDEMLEMYDSVSEYNENADFGSRIPLSTIVIFGWPNSFEGRDRELLQRIMTNYERYGISFITIAYRNSEKDLDKEKSVMPEYALQNAIHINMTKNNNTIEFADGAPQNFTWYSFNDSLTSEFIESVKNCKIEKDIVGNEYTKRYSLANIPQYIRDYKKIELPFGIDGKDQAHSLSFENENFATYLVGASRSGKSTLLHTLIAGLIRNYHPDNVELWLADFKQLEFKRYIKHLPPHVKYVLLDESTELVFDLIDKLTAEMMERQKLFSRLGKQRIDQVDPTILDKPLPVIFVILDEFSIMSQSIAESPIYKLKLQNILAKGAALGIKFLFSSQTFTTGIAGLTPTARAQIQQRIAMKGSKEEISETLELSANLKTEQVRNWMDALPPHYALVKFRISADTLPQVKRFLVMYFEDYAPRDQMIESIADSMHAVDEYNPTDIASYMNKHPVLVDGNTFDAFDDEEFLQYVRNYKIQQGNDFSGDEMFVSFGTPRLMVKTKASALSMETRENILLVSRSAEQQCAASILLSAMKSFKLQNGEIEVWTYSKNRLYRTYKQIFADTGAKIVEDLDDICEAISSLKKDIVEKKTSNKLIVLIGIERICMDFDYIIANNGPGKKSVQDKIMESGAVTTAEDWKRKMIANAFEKIWVPIEKKLEKEEKSSDEIKNMRRIKIQEFKKSDLYKKILESDNSYASDDSVNKMKIEDKPAKSYNAKSDFDFIVKHGSRLGYHFMLNLNNFADLKLCALKIDYFRYRLAFQVSVDDSRSIFNNKVASTLPEHICQFDDSLEHFSFRPYLHHNVSWDGWSVQPNGEVSSPYSGE